MESPFSHWLIFFFIFVEELSWKEGLNSSSSSSLFFVSLVCHDWCCLLLLRLKQQKTPKTTSTSLFFYFPSDFRRWTKSIARHKKSLSSSPSPISLHNLWHLLSFMFWSSFSLFFLCALFSKKREKREQGSGGTQRETRNDGKHRCFPLIKRTAGEYISKSRSVEKNKMEETRRGKDIKRGKPHEEMTTKREARNKSSCTRK